MTDIRTDRRLRREQASEAGVANAALSLGQNLALDAPGCKGLGMQPRGRDRLPAVHAPSPVACFESLECGFARAIFLDVASCVSEIAGGEVIGDRLIAAVIGSLKCLRDIDRIAELGCDFGTQLLESRLDPGAQVFGLLKFGHDTDPCSLTLDHPRLPGG